MKQDKERECVHYQIQEKVNVVQWTTLTTVLRLATCKHSYAFVHWLFLMGQNTEMS